MSYALFESVTAGIGFWILTTTLGPFAKELSATSGVHLEVILVSDIECDMLRTLFSRHHRRRVKLRLVRINLSPRSHSVSVMSSLDPYLVGRPVLTRSVGLDTRARALSLSINDTEKSLCTHWPDTD